MTISGIIRALCLCGLAAPAYASHPLITDDTGTQGRSKVQLELVGEYSRAEDAGVLTRTFVWPTMPVVSVGILDSVDLVSGIAYQRATVSDAEGEVTQAGATDLAVDVKWRLCERDGLSLALKPGLTFPTGDETKGLGAGRSTQHLLLIATQKAGPWTLHANLGWTRNANRAGNREGLWHASAAAARSLGKGWTAVVDAGADTDPDPALRRTPVYALAGLIYSVSDRLDLDLGAKRSFNVSGSAHAFLAGMTIRF